MKYHEKYLSQNSPFCGSGGQMQFTDDGSHTLYLPEIDECYHSTKGAVQESIHIFINAGCRQCKKSEINVLEIGFGTGLNALLTALIPTQSDSPLTTESEMGKKINYTAVELYPVPVEKALQLNYPEIIGTERRSFFEKIHTCEWNKPVKITENFTLTKLQSDFTTIQFTEKFDVIYFDAFSPEKQPEMWTEKLFKKLYLCTAENGTITTYCAKGAVRRAMQAAGFSVERLPGPPGKREMLRATAP